MSNCFYFAESVPHATDRHGIWHHRIMRKCGADSVVVLDFIASRPLAERMASAMNSKGE